jgi:CRISPR-associated endonuclease/helicase Cas3
MLMSASIPDRRLDVLRQKLGERMAEPIRGDPALEELPRYVLRRRDSADACWPEVKQAIQEHKQKVLWVCNTVDDARHIYRQAVEEHGLEPVVLYHSRYRYNDRVKRQKSILGHFLKDQNGNPIFGKPVLIVATQVCEISLNISAQLLVSTLPPFPALMQRLGRLNRFAKREAGKTEPPPRNALIYPFDCQDNHPYGKDELAVARRALEPLYDLPKSQRDLAEVLSALPLYEEIETDSAWVDGIRGVWESDQLPLRKGDVSLTVLLERDRQTIEEELRSKRQKPSAQTLAGWTVPMLFRKGLPYKEWPLWGGYRVVPQDWIAYDERLGAEWLVKRQN